jgi:HAMP domain-containing protein
MSSSTSNSNEIPAAVDSYLKKEIRRYSKIGALSLSLICAGGGLVFKVVIENKLNELSQAKDEISREMGRMEVRAQQMETVLETIRKTESQAQEFAAKIGEHKTQITTDFKAIDEALSSQKKKAADAQLLTRKLEDRVKQLEANVEQTVQVMQRKSGEISSAAQAVEQQMAQQKKQRQDEIEARRMSLLKTEGLPGSAYRVVYAKDPKGVSVYLSSTNHVSKDAVGTVKFAESGVPQFQRLDVPEQSNDGTPQARVRFSGWVNSTLVDGAEAPALQDNPSQVLLSAQKGARLHQDPSADSAELLDFKPGKPLPAIATGETQADWIRVIIDAWMPVRFDRSINTLLIAPAKSSGG